MSEEFFNNFTSYIMLYIVFSIGAYLTVVLDFYVSKRNLKWHTVISAIFMLISLFFNIANFICLLRISGVNATQESSAEVFWSWVGTILCTPYWLTIGFMSTRYFYKKML